MAETDVLDQVADFLNANMTGNIPAGIVPAFNVLDKVVGFPQVGIHDGGDQDGAGTSEWLNEETIFVSFYAEITGDIQECVRSVRKVAREGKQLLNDPGICESTGPFAGYTSIKYMRSREALAVEHEDNSFVLAKTIALKFKRREVQL